MDSLRLSDQKERGPAGGGGGGGRHTAKTLQQGGNGVQSRCRVRSWGQGRAAGRPIPRLVLGVALTLHRWV